MAVEDFAGGILIRKLGRGDCTPAMSAEGVIPFISPTKCRMMILAAVKRDLPRQKLPHSPPQPRAFQ